MYRHSCNTLYNQTFFEGHTEEGFLQDNELFNSANLCFPETHMQEEKSACDKKKMENEAIRLLKETNVERAPGRTHLQTGSSSTNS